MMTGTFPRRIEVENVLLGTSRLKGWSVVEGLVEVVANNVWLVFDLLRSVMDTESCRSCAQGWSVGSTKGGIRLHQVSLWSS
jgi:hypothetical protein